MTPFFQAETLDSFQSRSDEKPEPKSTEETATSFPLLSEEAPPSSSTSDLSSQDSDSDPRLIEAVIRVWEDQGTKFSDNEYDFVSGNIP